MIFEAECPHVPERRRTTLGTTNANLGYQASAEHHQAVVRCVHDQTVLFAGLGLRGQRLGL